MIAVQKADASFIPAIKQLAHITWQVTYKEILSAAQLDYMLHLFYDESSLQKQMNEEHQFIVAIENNEVVGFASYAKKDKQSSVYKLHKIYVHPEHQGKKIGNVLLNYIIDEIKIHHATALELNVNRHNKALNFYQKNNFEIIGEEDVDIGNGYFMNDFIMNREL